jgi:hypothetical protein
MARITIQYVQMDFYHVPDEVARKGHDAMMEYIAEKLLDPEGSESNEWDIVDVELDSGMQL